jgi:transcription antitermination factor NusG
MDGQSWYAIYTRANHEKRVATHLTHVGVENYLPLYETLRKWSDRRVRLELPLFPGYLFVRTALRQRLPILQAPGVVRMVGSGGTPVPLNGDQIDRLRGGLAQVLAEPYPQIPVGQRVRIIAGPLLGMEGVLLRRKSGLRVVVSIELIQRSFVADIDSDALTPIVSE